MPHDSRTDWWVVVPVKGGRGGKSRLRRSRDDSDLVAAISHDTLDVVARLVGPERVLVVTSDPDEVAHAEERRYAVLPDPGTGLDSAAQVGVAAAVGRGARGVAVLLGDHPALTADELSAALEAGGRHTSFFVPDADGEGTAMVGVAHAGELPTAFGAGSASRHEALGHVRLELALPGLRQDVDDEASLMAAARTGTLGPRTRAALGRYGAGVQASVNTFAEDGSGSALLDDGRLVTWDGEVFAGSALRHVRPGQRVSIELEGDAVTRLWIVGIGQGEVIR